MSTELHNNARKTSSLGAMFAQAQHHNNVHRSVGRTINQRANDSQVVNSQQQTNNNSKLPRKMYKHTHIHRVSETHARRTCARVRTPVLTTYIDTRVCATDVCMHGVWRHADMLTCGSLSVLFRPFARHYFCPATSDAESNSAKSAASSSQPH